MTDKNQGIIWILVSCLGAAIMVTLVRYLSENLHPFQIVFFRNSIALLLFLPWFIRNGPGVLKTRKLPMYATRAVFGVSAMFAWFYSLSIVPLGQATALSFTAPLFSSIGAVLILKEKSHRHRWAALIIGFFGVIIILRPGFEGFSYTMLLVLVTASMWSLSGIIIKTLTKTEKPETIVFFMVLLMTPLSFPAAIPYWKNPTLNEWLWIFVLGFVSNYFQIAMSRAFSKTDLTVLLPFDFSRLIFVSIIAYFVFGEIPDAPTYIGATVILGSALYVTYSESRAHKKLRMSEDSLGN